MVWFAVGLELGPCWVCYKLNGKYNLFLCFHYFVGYVLCCVVDRHHIDADPHLTFDFDADPDPHPTPALQMLEKTYKKIRTFLHGSAS
jgi:hypothetical protein